jgi:hypothetical protein
LKNLYRFPWYDFDRCCIGESRRIFPVGIAEQVTAANPHFDKARREITEHLAKPIPNSQQTPTSSIPKNL